MLLYVRVDSVLPRRNEMTKDYKDTCHEMECKRCSFNLPVQYCTGIDTVCTVDGRDSQREPLTEAQYKYSGCELYCMHTYCSTVQYYDMTCTVHCTTVLHQFCVRWRQSKQAPSVSKKLCRSFMFLFSIPTAVLRYQYNGAW